MFYKVVNLGNVSGLSTTLDSDSGSDSASSKGDSWYTKKTEISDLYISSNGVPIREHFNNIYTIFSR